MQCRRTRVDVARVCELVTSTLSHRSRCPSNAVVMPDGHLGHGAVRLRHHMIRVVRIGSSLSRGQPDTEARG
jgi:hypothetical protein